jgi:putative ABC transport system permease protein
MLKNFFITSLRYIRKNRLYSFINISGLALGVACCMITFVMIRFETSFDDFHSNADHIYRVNLNYQTPQGLELSGYNFTPLAGAIRHEVTGIRNVTGVYCLHSYQFTKDRDIFEEKYAFFADEEYPKVFDLQWVAGNPQQALSKPGTVIVTDRFAEKFLGGQSNALGTTILLESRVSLTVVGIVKEPPPNTDQPYSMLISYSSLPQFFPEGVDDWDNVRAGATFILANETPDDQLYTQLNGVIKKHLKEDVAKNTKFFLMPLNDNHDRNYDYSSFTYDFPVPVMVILSVVAGMIAFIACVNFVNLSTAQSLKRSREVGIRKTMGSSRMQLVAQHMSEAFVITLISVLLGLVFAKIGMIKLNELYGGEYLKFDLLNEPSTIIFILAITVVISILAGFYPAFVLSRYKPVIVLRSQTFSGKTRGFSLRKSLVVLQFAGAQILILVTVILINQILHFRQRPIGFDPETIVLLPHLRGNEQMQYSRLQKELDKVPGIIGYTFSYGLPEGGDPSEFSVKAGVDKKNGFVNYVDQSFLSVFQLKVISGENFSSDQIQASSEVMVNEALVKKLGIETPNAAVGSIFFVGEEQVKIRAVVKDFYTQALSSTIDPVIMRYDPDPAKLTGVAMNISTTNITGTIKQIEDAWKNVYPEYLCKYQFMDEVVNRRYGFLNTIITFLGVGSFVAIFIGCLGMYGLISFMAVQRTKEIGIRKVFGATVKNILMMFTHESGLLILFAFVLATPVAYFFGNAMLSELPERIPQRIEIYALTFLVSLFIALITVSYRAFSAAIQNPVESLKTE